MEERFLKEFEAKLKEKGIVKEIPEDLIAWRITERKKVKRHKAVAFRLTDRTAAALNSLSERTGASKTDVVEKLILVAEILMRCPEWDEVDETVTRERRDTVTVETTRIVSK